MRRFIGLLGDKATADTDVNELLTQTFTGSKEIKSGNLALQLKLDAKGRAQSSTARSA